MRASVTSRLTVKRRHQKEIIGQKDIDYTKECIVRVKLRVEIKYNSGKSGRGKIELKSLQCLGNSKIFMLDSNKLRMHVVIFRIASTVKTLRPYR